MVANGGRQFSTMHCKTKVIKTNYDITKKFRIFLRLLGLSEVNRNDKNEIEKTSNVKCIAVLLFIALLEVVCITLRFMYTEWRSGWAVSTYADAAKVIVSTVSVVSIIVLNNRIDMVKLRNYYKNYRKIDSILNLNNNEYYDRETKKTNKRFLFQTLVYFLKVTIEIILFNMNLTIWEMTPYTNTYVTNCMLYFNLVYMYTAFVIIESKFIYFERLLKLELPMRNQVWDVEKSFVQNAAKYRRCFYMLCEQHMEFSVFYGWQVLTACINMLLVCSHSLFSVVLERDVYWLPALLFNSISEVVISGVLMTVIAGAIERIVAVRARISMHLEELLVKRLLTKPEELHVSALLSQVYRHPLNFSVCQLFDLNFHTLQMMFSLGISYIMLFIQLQKKQAHE